MNSGPGQEQYQFLTTEPSLPLMKPKFCRRFWTILLERTTKCNVHGKNKTGLPYYLFTHYYFPLILYKCGLFGGGGSKFYSTEKGENFGFNMCLL